MHHSLLLSKFCVTKMYDYNIPRRTVNLWICENECHFSQSSSVFCVWRGVKCSIYSTLGPFRSIWWGGCTRTSRQKGEYVSQNDARDKRRDRIILDRDESGGGGWPVVNLTGSNVEAVDLPLWLLSGNELVTLISGARCHSVTSDLSRDYSISPV